jgi:hypothetical protein
MPFRNSITGGLVFILIYLSGYEDTMAQSGTDHLKINLERIRKNELKVTYYPSEKNREHAISFPSFIQNSYFPIEPDKFISKPKAYDDQNKKVGIKTSNKEFIPLKKVAYWEYVISKKHFPKTISEANRLHFQKKRFSFLNPGLLYPVAKGNSLKHKISIRDHISDSVVSVSSFEFDNRKSLNAFVFGASRNTIEIEDSAGRYAVLFHGRFKEIHRSEMSKIIKSLVSAFQKTTKIQIPMDFQFHLIEGQAKNNSLPRSACFGNGISVVLDPASNIFQQRETLIRQCIWQLFRWISPVSSHDGSYDQLNPIDGNHTFHLWYFESVTEYLSLVCLVKNRLIDERYFTKIMQNKVSKSIEEPNFSLIQLGTEFGSQTGWLEIKNNLKACDVFTNRGVVAAMIIDIIMLNENEGQAGLLQKFLQIYSTHQNEPYFA